LSITELRINGISQEPQVFNYQYSIIQKKTGQKGRFFIHIRRRLLDSVFKTFARLELGHF
jgi:hypothetical protein